MFGASFILALVALASLAFGAPLPRQTNDEAGHELLSLRTTDGLSYSVTMTVGGDDFQLQVDTGGSDTWLVGSPSGTKESSDLTLNRDTVTGDVFFSDFDFGGTNIPNQFYVQADKSKSQSPLSGVLGLGFSGRSQIFDLLDSDLNTKDTAGGPFATSFIENFSSFVPSSPFMTLLLPRTNTSSGGSLGFGKVLPEHSNITSQTKLQSQDTLWRVHLDEAGITVNGRNVTLPPTIFDGTGPNELRVSFDSGFETSTIRSDVATAMYDLVPTAFFDSNQKSWRLPCDAEINVTLSFGGVHFPVHPLDTVLDRNLSDSTCLGSFQPFEDDTKYTGDLVLGTSFMHNAYLLMSTAGFDGENDPTPYMQLLPITDPVAAHQEFLALRKPTQPQVANAAAGPDSVDFQAEEQRLRPNGAETNTRAPSAALAAVTVGLVGVLSFF